MDKANELIDGCESIAAWLDDAMKPRSAAKIRELIALARACSAAPAGQQAAPSEQVQKMVQKVFDWAELRESEAARFFHNSRICDIQQLVEFIMKNHIPFVPDHSFDHLEGRGLHELRTDELPAYLSAVAHNHGARSGEFITAAQWVGSEIDRKTTEELVAAKRAHELADSLKEAKAATNLAWNEALELAATTCDYAKKSTPPRQLAEQIRSLKDKAPAKRADSLPYESLLNGFISIMGVEDSGDLLDDARRAIDKVNALIASEFAASLEADLAKNDAARYRWLCSNNYDCQSVQIHTWHHWYEPHSVTGEPTEWKARVRGCALDQIIDAAIAAQPKDTTDTRRDA